MQLAHYGELYRLVESGPMSESMARHFYRQIVQSIPHSFIVIVMKYLHHKELLAHCDIKSENLLVNGEFEVILSDFGFCVPCDQMSEQVMTIGSPEYNPPEVMEGQKIRSLFPIDVFQSGVVLFMMLFNSRPF